MHIVTGFVGRMFRRPTAPPELPAEPAPAPVEDKQPRLWRLIEFVTTITGSVTLIGAILFYFGWARTGSTYAYFGLDVSVADLSSQDYLLRSVNSAFWGVGMAVGLGIVALVAHGYAVEELGSRFVPIGRTLVATGAGVIAAGVLVLNGVGDGLTRWPIAPPAMLLGLGLVTYGSHLIGRTRERSQPAGLRALLLALAVLLAFWTTSSYASYLGNVRAQQLAANLDARPHVVLYSKQDLGLTASGTYPRTRKLPPTGLYRFRYDGLRLLIRSGGKYFLVPADWTRSRGSVFVVRDSDDLRAEFSANQ